MPAFYDHQDITPAGTSGWQTVDLSAIIPSGATGVAVVCVDAAGGTVGCGIREYGSSTDTMSGIQDGIRAIFMSKCSSDRKIDLYRADAGLSYYLVYAFGSEAVFFNAASWVTKTTSTAGSYVDVDISSDTGADTAIAGIFLMYGSGGDDHDIALRKKGATFDLPFKAVYRYNSGVQICPVDASEVCQQYMSLTGVALKLVGYIKSGWTFVDYTDYSIGTTASYTDLSALPSGALGGLFHVRGPIFALPAHLRKNGSTTDLYYNVAGQQLVEGDASRVTEGKISNTAMDWYLVGYPTASEPSISIPVLAHHYRSMRG